MTNISCRGNSEEGALDPNSCIELSFANLRFCCCGQLALIIPTSLNATRYKDCIIMRKFHGIFSDLQGWGISDADTVSPKYFCLDSPLPFYGLRKYKINAGHTYI